MKKTFVLVIIACLLAGFTPDKKRFTIKGTIEIVDRKNYTRGFVYLIIPNVEPDTIARAVLPAPDTTFTLTGEIDRPTGAVVHFRGLYGKEGALQLMLYTLKDVNMIIEGGEEYEVSLGNRASIVRGGGEHQHLGTVFENFHQNSVTRAAQLSNILKKIPAEDTLARFSARVDVEMFANYRLDKLKRLITTWPESPVSAFYAEQMTASHPIDVQRQIYELLGGEAQASDAGKRMLARIEMRERLTIGRVLADFTMETPDGKTVALHSLRGKVKLIDFWASWCMPCRQENPEVKKLYEEYHSKGLEIVGISCDTHKDRWLKAIEEDGLPWQHGWKTRALTLFGIESIPFTILVDKKNRVIATRLRGAALRAKIAELLD
jgi:thiol-disulfide isomerase/thioredoxin